MKVIEKNHHNTETKSSKKIDEDLKLIVRIFSFKNLKKNEDLREISFFVRSQ